MSGETSWPKWHGPATPADPKHDWPALPTMLGYPRTTERISLENWMSLYCALKPEERTRERMKVALKNGQNLSHRWLATLPRP